MRKILTSKNLWWLFIIAATCNAVYVVASKMNFAGLYQQIIVFTTANPFVFLLLQGAPTLVLIIVVAGIWLSQAWRDWSQKQK